jgi:hypothetical protein
MDRQVVCGDDVALLREGTEIDPLGSPQEQVDHSTAPRADEMIVRAGHGIESRSLFVEQERADLPLGDETVEVAIHRGEADAGQLSVNPPIDLVGEGMRVIVLERLEHLFQLTCRTFADGPPHRLPRILAVEQNGARQWLRHIKSSAACQVVSRLRVLHASGSRIVPIVRIITR